MSLFSLHSKWKADRAAVTSLCVSPDGKLLLSAGQTIKMWDLDTKEVYRVTVLFKCLIYIHIFLDQGQLFCFQVTMLEATLLQELCY